MPPSGFAKLLGFRYVRSDDTEAVVEVMPDAEHCNERGSVHGGFLAALMDTATGFAVHSALGSQAMAPHFHLTVQYLTAAAPGTMLSCVARTTKTGRRAAATEAEVRQDGTLIARAVASHVVL